MSNTALTQTKPEANCTLLNKQVGQAKALLCQMRETIEDVEDAHIIERAKRAHGNKPRIPGLRSKRTWICCKAAGIRREI